MASYAQILAPVLAATLAGGSGYLSSSRGRGRPGETEEERRSRILRNTLGMGAAGGVAGLAIPAAVSILSDAAPERDLFARLAASVPAPLRGVAGGWLGAALGRGSSDPAQAERRAIADVEARTRKAFPGAHRGPDAQKFRGKELSKIPTTDAFKATQWKRTGAGGVGGAAVGLAAPYVGEAMGHPLLAPLMGLGVGGWAGSKIGPTIPRAHMQGPNGKHWGGALGALLGGVLGSGLERGDEVFFKGNPINPF